MISCHSTVLLYGSTWRRDANSTRMASLSILYKALLWMKHEQLLNIQINLPKLLKPALTVRVIWKSLMNFICCKKVSGKRIQMHSCFHKICRKHWKKLIYIIVAIVNKMNFVTILTMKQRQRIRRNVYRVMGKLISNHVYNFQQRVFKHVKLLVLMLTKIKISLIT